MTKYHTSKKWRYEVTIYFLIAVGPIWLFNYKDVWSSPRMWAVLAVLTLAMFYAWKGVYIELDSKKICKTNNFFFKKCLNVASISSIKCAGTFRFGEEYSKIRWSLYIFSRTQDKNLFQIEIPNHTFSDENIIEILKNLKRINPDINIDERSSDLLNH